MIQTKNKNFDKFEGLLQVGMHGDYKRSDLTIYLKKKKNCPLPIFCVFPPYYLKKETNMFRIPGISSEHITTV